MIFAALHRGRPARSAVIRASERIASRGEATGDMKRKIIRILLAFCHVRNALGTRKTVRRMLHSIGFVRLTEIDHLQGCCWRANCSSQSTWSTCSRRSVDEFYAGRSAAKCERYSGQAEVGTSRHGMSMKIFAVLVLIFRFLFSGNHIFQTCYNSCQLNKGRQEEAARAAIDVCDPVEFSPEAIFFLLWRPGERGEEPPDVATAARRSGDVHQASHGRPSRTRTRAP
ncbi:hypothetical protein H4582DRAFT_403748 [Lactarius indigo]|nr:hypothetical protein H4582DRAFT_403748 [Lactarius indigo]